MYFGLSLTQLNFVKNIMLFVENCLLKFDAVADVNVDNTRILIIDKHLLAVDENDV